MRRVTVATDGSFDNVKTRQRHQSIAEVADAATVERFMAGILSVAAERDPFLCSERAIGVACDVLKCERASMFYIDGDELVMFVSRGAKSIRLPLGKGIAGSCAQEGRMVNIPQAYSDDRFDQTHDKATGFVTRSILCAPVVDIDGNTVGALQCINKLGAKPFSAVDETLLANLVAHVGVSLRNAQLYEEARSHDERVLKLLEIVRMIHSEHTNPNSLMFTLSTAGNKLVDADRGTLYLVDRTKEELVVMQGDLDLRFPMTSGVAGKVATSGEAVNIADAYDDPSFNRSFDKKSGYRTKQILCLPIFNSEQQVIGVMQLINRTDDMPFSDTDSELLVTLLGIAGPIIERANVFAAFAKSSRRQLGDADEATAALYGAAGIDRVVSAQPDLDEIGEEDEEEEEDEA